MAVMNKLVVNLSANTRRFDKSMKRSQSSVRRLAGNVAKLGAAYLSLRGANAAGRWMLGLAADAEVLQVKMATLLKSEERAADLVKQINVFAASTPFQKMDIGNAAQMLLAFNVRAEDVMETLKNIGDIAALTGSSIFDLAEIYGKIHVSGRVMADDINQLLGRGIPIIQALAKQFGVADSAVRQLVTDGKVTAEHIRIAFEDMTTGAGQFAGGMEKLSQTTAGQWSTLKDNVAALGVELGSVLLPTVNLLVAAMTSFVKTTTEGFKNMTRAARGFISVLSDQLRMMIRSLTIFAQLKNLWPLFPLAAVEAPHEKWLREMGELERDAMPGDAAGGAGPDAGETSTGKKFASALGRGTQQAYSAIMNATGNKQNQKLDAVVANGREANALLRQIADQTREGAATVVPALGIA